MTEDEIRFDLPAYLAGELDSVREGEVEAALDADPELRNELAELDEVITLLQGRSLRESGDDMHGPARSSRSHGGRKRALTWFVAAAVGLAAAVAGFLVLAVRDADDPPVAKRTYLLEPIGESTAQGEARIRTQGGTGVLDLRIDSLGHPAPNTYYEVWLLSPEGSMPMSLGVVPSDGGRVSMPEGIPSDYSVVDVSVETVGGDPGHSGISVLRSSPI